MEVRVKMNFDQLNTFISVVETGSFQKTAKTKYVSQRSVSQSMQKLEEELGFELFKRGKNKIIVTDQGQAFFLKTKEMLHSYFVEINSLRHQTTSVHQEFKIGYFSPFEGALMRKQVYAFSKKYPNIKFKITEESIEHLISDVSLGILDMAYILDYGSQEFLTKNLTSKTVFQSTMVIGVSKLNPLCQNNTFPIKALKDKPMLYYSPEKTNYLKHAFLATLPEAYQNIPVARVSTIEQMQTLVTANQANAYYPDGLIQLGSNTESEISYLPLQGNENSQKFKIQSIYPKQSKKCNLINQFLG